MASAAAARPAAAPAASSQSHSLPASPWAPRAPAIARREAAQLRCSRRCANPRRRAAAAAAPPAAAASEQQQQASSAAAPLPAEQLPLLLSGVRIVLVAPKTPANVGAVLRVAENFEAHDVVVVAPRCDPRCDEVLVTSCDSPLFRDGLRTADSLADALADCVGSIGFTRRAGAGRVVHASLRQMLARHPAAVPALLQPPAALAQAAPGATVALVFGREESGLLESELALCSHACSIPTGRQQPSMNLSHSVAVVAAQLFDLQQQRLLAAAAAQEQRPDKQRPEQQQQQQQQQAQQQAQQQPEGGGADFWAATLGPSGSLFESSKVRHQREQVLSGATQAELEALLSRAAALLEAAGISAQESLGGGDKGNHGRRRLLMGHLRALLQRGQASTPEVRALHGLLKELEGRQQGRQPRQGAS